MFPQFLHHGAADGVTGSCHRYIASEALHLLIDCGLFQGAEADSVTVNDTVDHTIDFDLGQVRGLIVTHVHIDHVGRLPYLLAAGFKGPIFCSVPSARLLPLVIEDAFKLGFTRDGKVVQQFLARVQEQLMPLDYQKWYGMVDQELLRLRVRLQKAGHILGSAYVELDLQWRESLEDKWRSHRTVFSGDLGAPHAPLLSAPKAPSCADTLIIESTYGNRVHEDRRERRFKLKQMIDRAIADGGTVLIPAFSIGRTQELLYELESLIPADSEVPIIVDSPLAAKFTEVYKELKPYWDEEALQRVRAGRHPLDFETLLTVDSHDDHLRVVRHLVESGRPAIVIAASGMAAGGRIVNYLKAMLENPIHNVLFVGYQARGTPGHDILRFGPKLQAAEAGSTVKHATKNGNDEPWVELDGERYCIRASVAAIGGYSAHADQSNLLSFVRNMRRWPQQIRIVHGTDESRNALRREYEALANGRSRTIEVLLPERYADSGLGG